MTSEDTLTKPLNEPHSPDERGVRLFSHASSKIKHELIRLRHHWDLHEPRMFSRARGISDHDLSNFNMERDLVSIRSGQTSYGTVIFGKVQLQAVNDEEGPGFIHIRLHDPPGNDIADVILHAILTEEIKKDGINVGYRAIMRQQDPLTWFDE